MEFDTVGSSGLVVSKIGLGCNNVGWTIDEPTSRAVVHKALDVGITLFDVADEYGETFGNSEKVLGQALGAHRKDAVILTKFGCGEWRTRDTRPIARGSRQYVTQAVEASLKRLGTDYIDIYMYHFPDPLTPIDETLQALDDIVRAGKVRYIAVSNQYSWQVVRADAIARELGTQKFIASENHYNLLTRQLERDLLPALKAIGLTLFPFFPLENGMLAGKYRKGEALIAGDRLADDIFLQRERLFTDRNFDIVEALTGFCQERGHSLNELSLSWLLHNPIIPSVCVGASRPEQVEKNVKAIDWKLSREDLAFVDQLTALPRSPIVGEISATNIYKHFNIT